VDFSLLLTKGSKSFIIRKAKKEITMSNLFFKLLNLLLTCLLLILIILFPILVTWDNVLFLSLAILSICIYKIMKDKKNQASKTNSSQLKKVTTASIIIFWKIVAFVFICVLYIFLYGMQGFMSYSPQFWPLPIVLILSACIFFVPGKLKYFFYIGLFFFAIGVDISGLKRICPYESCGTTSVFSPILLVFWGCYLPYGLLGKSNTKDSELP